MIYLGVKKKVSLSFLLHAHSPVCVHRIGCRSLANQQQRVRPQTSTSTFEGNIQTANFQIFLKTSHGAGASDIFEQHIHLPLWHMQCSRETMLPNAHSLGTSAFSAHTSDTSLSPTHASRAEVFFLGGLAYIYIYIHMYITLYMSLYIENN